MDTKSPISRFIGGRLHSEMDKKVRRFLGSQHNYHCRAIIGENFYRVHKQMDRKRGGGKKHRIYGHGEEFIKRRFSSKDIDASYIHLLGDFVSDLLPDVFRYVFTYIKKNKIKPPFMLRNGHWDFEKEIINKLSKRLAEILIITLKSNKTIIR